MSTAESRISMEDIMNASFGEVSNKITVTFKKTVLIRDYETEVFEATNTVEFDHPLVGIERMFVAAIMQIQMEYTGYINLTAKGLITQSELALRRKSLEEGLYCIKYKADEILGKDVINKYLDFNNLDKWGL